MNIEQNEAFLQSEACQSVLNELYGQEAEQNRARYQAVLAGYEKSFGDGEVCLFTSAGRTEIAGNHTDHNHGKVLAASINLDCVAAAGKNGTDQIRIISETFHQDFVIDLKSLDPSDRYAGTQDLTKGIIRAFHENGYKAGGFNAYVTSNVIASAGVSSSASYEMLVCSILNTLFNDGKIDVVSYAHMGKYAENVYWKKASGLMDQMACAVGGLISLDFKNPLSPKVDRLDFDFAPTGYAMIMVQTGKGHADLSEEYSSIPLEMKAVAAYFGKETLSECTEEELIENLAKVRAACGDRAVMRAFHFFEENKRVDRAVNALHENRFEDALSCITASGNSSWKYLQNTYVTGAVKEQGIPVALALTEIYLQKKGRGACRVNGGGFAGVIQTFLPEEDAAEYVRYIDGAIGEGSAHIMKIRPIGAACLETLCR
ncbi:MAG: galactokinase family protein [Eubacteriales bacterium]|nr:galactokinase family protein [Eubacteriales bacterium]